MKIKYNAPITLSFAIISISILFINQLFRNTLIPAIFTIPGKNDFNPSFFFNYIRLFTHIAGHISWSHLLGNFSFILLLGPVLEEKYGSNSLLKMILITALITGLVNALFIPTALLGASGVAFMMILLISFTNFKNNEIPLTFILIFILYLTKEIIGSMHTNNISELAHILGGICGSLFGFKKAKLVTS